MAEMIDQIAETACDNLPSGWLIRFEFSEGEMSVDLEDPEGERVDEWDGGDPDKTLLATVKKMVDYARVSDGLQPVDGEPV